MSARRYLYIRSDFVPLPVKLEHIELYLDFADGRVEVNSTLLMTAMRQIEEVSLDARDLEVRSVELAGEPPLPLRFEVRDNEHKLLVRLPAPAATGGRFAIRTRTVCTPTDNMLEGIYKDTTPPGCPQQYMSQCQQWGFQRIAPVLDDCTAKCTWVTTIEADARYTHLVSNGDVSRARNPDGRPVLKPGDASRKLITYENRIPMAPYLFLVCAGTWDALEDEVVYPSGRRVKLGYLVPPGRKDGAAVPMRILKDAVQWMARAQHYEYPREVYRTICMEKSNFGGMENVGNTTIITSAALVDEFTTDARLEYAHGVIVHEFEHNQCGSDVTMETPFDIWLNEAYTVDVERRYLSEKLDRDCLRVTEIDAMRDPLWGPLATEDAGHHGNIVREGFNDPDELVDGVTYVKAAEVINMLRLLLGPGAFARGEADYFSRYGGGNANTDQFFACFERAGGRDLSQFKREWLHTIGYPVLDVSWRYDAASRRLLVSVGQQRSERGTPGAGLFHLPLRIAAVDAEGKDIAGVDDTIEITGTLTERAYGNVPPPAFVSWNRDCSFYGVLRDRSATPESLVAQAMRDGNGFNRVEAMRRLTDIERIALLREPGRAVGERWLGAFDAVLRDPNLRPGLKALLLRIEELSLDRATIPMFRERWAARSRLLKAAAERCMHKLVAVFRATDAGRRSGDPLDGLQERRLRAVLLRTIVEADTPAARELAAEHFSRSRHISDRMAALGCINLGGHPRRREFMEEGYALCSPHVNAYPGYLGLVGAGTHDDVFELMAVEERRSTFKLANPGHSRSLFAGMAANNRMLWTDRGLQWAAETVIRLAAVNENTAVRLLGSFKFARQLPDDLRPKALAALAKMAAEIDLRTAPSVHGRVSTYLANE